MYVESLEPVVEDESTLARLFVRRLKCVTCTKIPRKYRKHRCWADDVDDTVAFQQSLFESTEIAARTLPGHSLIVVVVRQERREIQTQRFASYHVCLAFAALSPVRQ
ncbi:hypothetical protein Y032_0005g2685 [Ancylostoma ceylanicum]|uniref:Uncharacterized protein n=1 Tax=Ancylostoma ceylanicum TaxID=53326 RepID=A0A016VU01_9BILA|nr:hypothetical protein Y032_0005g2685 [Ancylostoma ceylanicum]